MNQHNRNLPGSNDMIDVSNPDVAKMSPSDLQAHIDDLIKVKAEKVKEAFYEAIRDIDNIITKKMNIEGVNNIHDLSAYLLKNEADVAKTKSRTKQRRAVSHYWLHRTNPDFRWTGRGQVIGWLRDEMISVGDDPTNKEAVKKYCEKNLDFISNNN